MKMMSRMVAVGAMLIGASGVGHAYSENENCPGDDDGVLTIYDNLGNDATLCLPSGTTSYTYVLQDLSYQYGELYSEHGDLPLYRDWSGNIAYWSLSQYGAVELGYEVTFGHPGPPGYCSESYGPNRAYGAADFCVGIAYDVTIQLIDVPHL